MTTTLFLYDFLISGVPLPRMQVDFPHPQGVEKQPMAMVQSEEPRAVPLPRGRREIATAAPTLATMTGSTTRAVLALVPLQQGVGQADRDPDPPGNHGSQRPY